MCWRKARILAGSSWAGATTSARPASIALRGIPSNFADDAAERRWSGPLSYGSQARASHRSPCPKGRRPRGAARGPRRARGRSSRLAGVDPEGTAEKLEHAVEDREIVFGGIHVDVLRLDSLVIPGLQDRHRAPPLQELYHCVLVLRIRGAG